MRKASEFASGIGAGDPLENKELHVGARWLLAAGVGTLVMLLGTDPPQVFLLMLSILTFDTQHPTSLKNFFLAYLVIVFGIGGGLMHLTPESVAVDALAYAAAYLLGYFAFSSRGANFPRERTVRMPELRAEINVSSVRVAILLLGGLNLLFLAFQLGRFGVAGYYQGQQLLSQFSSSGQAAGESGLEQIVRFFLAYSAVGFVILYVCGCIRNSERIVYKYPVALLIALPILSLKRSEAVMGALAVFAIVACDRCLRKSGQTIREPKVLQSVSHTPERGAHLRNFMLIATFLGAVAAAVSIGNLRQGVLADAGLGSTGGSIVFSELAPVKAYGEIKRNIDVLGYQGGSTILYPLLFKVVPRAWLPGKPLNSGAYYMTTLRGEEFAAGFALPPTFFGDAYLSFGFVGALLLCAFLGAISFRGDCCLRRGDVNKLQLYLVLFTGYLGLLRNPLSESIAAILLSGAVVLVGSYLFRRDRGREVRSLPQPGDPHARLLKIPD